MGNNGSGGRTLIKVDDLKEKRGKSFLRFAWNFLVDYKERHAHPLNAALHIVGVPSAFFGFYCLLARKDYLKGSGFVVLGYLLQYLGHRAQGNEVSEVTLFKSIYRKLLK